MRPAPSAALLDALRARLQSGFTPELLHKDYREQWSPENPAFGFCSVASEAAWFMLGGRNAGWVAWSARDTDQSTHWWLRHESGVIFDPTSEQYTSIGRKPPYARGISGQAGGFMGIREDLNTAWPGQRRPSARARALMERLGVVEGEQAVEPPIATPRRGLRP